MKLFGAVKTPVDLKTYEIDVFEVIPFKQRIWYWTDTVFYTRKSGSVSGT